MDDAHHRTSNGELIENAKTILIALYDDESR